MWLDKSTAPGDFDLGHYEGEHERKINILSKIIFMFGASKLLHIT
jgi:hypothetical protein